MVSQSEQSKTTTQSSALTLDQIEQEKLQDVSVMMISQVLTEVKESTLSMCALQIMM